MRQGYVSGLARPDGERHPDNARLGVVETGCLGIEGKLSGLLQALQPVVQLHPRQYGFVLGSILRPGSARNRWLRTVLKFSQPALETKLRVQLAQRFLVLWPDDQGVGRGLHFHVTADRREFARQFQRIQVGTQVLSCLALDLPGMGDDRVKGPEGPQPVCCRLRADTGNSGNIVGAVPGQRQEVDNQPGWHPEFLLHAGTVHRGL